MEKKTGVMRSSDLGEFREYLMERENSALTIEKYMRDVRSFLRFAGESFWLTRNGLSGDMRSAV